jgi:RHS repeat-associated protein
MQRAVWLLAVASFIAIETLATTFSAVSAAGDGQTADRISSPAPVKLASSSITLDAQTRHGSFGGLDVFLPDNYVGALPVVVQASCWGRPETPSLAIDAKVYGENARLLNITSLPHGCASYQVAQITPAPQPSPTATPGAASTGIAVGLYYSVPPSAEGQLREPAIFVFNPVQGNWTAAKPFTPSAPEPQRAYATLSEQNHRIIGGVIAVPDSLQGQPAKNDPSALAKPLDQISPVDGYLAVKSIEPDNKGSYSVDLPLLLRPSRGPGPSFSIKYSSQGAPGVLGRGWDLHFSMVEVRGPSPIYNLAYETEDYLLDGMDLIALDGNGADIPSLYKGGPIIPRITSGARLFRLRNNSSGLIVRRYGKEPRNYYWEVWDPNSHVTKLYGGEFKDNASLPQPSNVTTANGEFLKGTLAPLGEGIGQWGLTQEYDSQPARNGARYSYAQDVEGGRACTGSFGNDCRSALRLVRIDYNLAFGVPTANVTASGLSRVELGWSQRDSARFNSDGRLGFFRAQEYWLDQIDVIYQPEPSSNLFKGVSLEADDILKAALAGQDLTKLTLFAKHKFNLKDGGACMNFDMVLDSYEVTGNSSYDRFEGGASPRTQTFKLGYEGQKNGSDGGCARDWSGGSPQKLGELPPNAVDGRIGFPAGLLSDLGFSMLTGKSLLGTSRTEETSGSLYVGIGLAGNPAVKDSTVGLKGGVNFSRTEGNSTLVDVTGDGIEDIVYRNHYPDKPGELRYCAGKRDDVDYSINYPTDRCGRIEGIFDLSISSTSTLSVGVEVYPGFTSFAGIGFNSSKTNTYVYFTDRDGDGLVDLVAYGQVFYGQGEDVSQHVVRFVSHSSLTPPIPGNVGKHRMASRIPADIRKTIQEAETRLEALSQRLLKLEYTQTTLAWQAPMDGWIAITGKFSLGTSKPDRENAGAFGVDFGPAEWSKLFDDVNNNQQNYVEPKASCKIWGEADYCHDPSDPFGPHYGAKPAQISFIKPPQANIQLARFQKGKGVTACSKSQPLPETEFDLASITIEPACRDADTVQQIRVQAGDVIYLTYSVHPHFNKWLKPDDVVISYKKVDDDPLFNSPKQVVIDSLSCKWEEQVAAGKSADCLLAKQARYRFSLKTGTIATAPSSVVELPPGINRVFGGKLDIPADIASDYQVYFEVLGAPRTLPDWPDLPDPAKPKPLAFGGMPPTNLKQIFQQDISALCSGAVGVCTVDIKRPCDGANAADCAAFTGDYMLATRLKIQHRTAVEPPLPARDISARLAALTWRIPPNVSSNFTEKDAPPGYVGKPTTVYLPVSMGDPDIEYLRVDQGVFSNPDTKLTDTSSKVDFKDILSDEKKNVELARLRQKVGLCGFADEILAFLYSHFSSSGEPYADDYLKYWTDKFDGYRPDCAVSRTRLKAVQFLDGATSQGERPELSGNGLRLPELLLNLPYAQQTTSAETLLERVLANLALGNDLFTDGPRLTRRGYRLPMKVNPLDCEVLSHLGKFDALKPIDAPIYGPEGPCAYRISANFSMQELEDLGISPPEARNIRDFLGRFGTSSRPAFEIELKATVNGRPLGFLELTGDSTGNEDCAPTTATKSCIRTYGVPVSDPTSDYFYPQRKGPAITDPHGDVLQRITVNKRVGRAVAFTNSIMDLRIKAQCARDYPAYSGLGAMEIKQDCLQQHPGQPPEIGPSDKYKSQDEAYRVVYTIGEDNKFYGRNRVLEFKARPFDVMELHFRLSGVQNTVPRFVGTPQDTVTGKFSIFEAVDHATPPPMGLMAGRHMIPRSPSQILPDGDFVLSCPAAPPPPGQPGPPPPLTRDRVTADGRLPTTCRPWTRLGWTEVLFGAQYRTYSDAQKLAPGGASNVYSIERRREILRLQPEIEVKADEYVLENDSDNLPLVEEFRTDKPAQAQGEVFNRHDPVVAKTGGDWALFAAKANADGALMLPPLFTQKPFVFPKGVTPPSDPPLRFPKTLSSQTQPTPSYDDARGSCAPLNNEPPKLDSCEQGLGSLGEQAVELSNFRFFPLIHRFVGPSNAAAAARLRGVPQAVRPATSVCGVEAPTSIASCWMGLDDTVFLEQAVLDQVAANEKDLYRTLYSASALKGLEKPLVAQFMFEFASYQKLICLDIELTPACPVSAGTTGSTVELPNRPLPPLPDRAVETFAPVQASQSRAISLNVGAAYVNADASVTDKRSTLRFQDVNGDGYPDVVSGNSAELTSPVGLSRREWWNYFRARENVPAPDFRPQADGYESKATALSGGAGIGLSASTFAQRPVPNASGSPDVNVDPSFSVSLESGYDKEFTELRDFNGDGIADKIVGKTVGDGLTLQFNKGNGGFTQDNQLAVGGGPVSGVHYNTSHGAGFGVRLGFSFAAGSVAVGTGLSHRDSGSQAALMDFTGDGRPDIVLPANDGQGSLLVYPNLGNGFGSYRTYRLKDWKSQPLPQLGGESGTALSETTLVDAGALYTTGFNVWFLKFVVTPGVKWARNQTRELLNIRDINGDGVPDVVAVSGRFMPMPGGDDVQTQVHYNPDGKYHLLTSVTNPSGSKWILKHGLFGNTGPENGRAIWALTGVARYDGYEPRQQPGIGATLPSDGQDVLLTTYKYYDGYYNRAERQFYGFAKRESKVYGCDLGETGATCLNVVQGIPDLTDTSLDTAKYRKLQTIVQTFGNRDFLTQGLELSKSVTGNRSSPMATTAPEQAVSRNTFAYSIDDFSSLTDGGQGACAAPTAASEDSWNTSRYAIESSRLSPAWDGSAPFGDNGKVFGTGSLCGADVGHCAQTLAQNVCNAGFVREQKAFWAQQSGSVRQRLVTLETFGIAPADDAAKPDGGASDRLRSAVAFDHDQWGQVLTLDSVGEARSNWTPIDESSANASVSYDQRQGRNSFRGTLPEPGFPMGQPTPGYPMLGLAGSLQIAAGPWKRGDDAPPLRARESTYYDDGTGNLRDICSYPGGEGFTFKAGICAAFRDNMQNALNDRYSTMQLALQAAYANTDGLPKGVSEFNAVIHHQLVGYDPFGNLTQSISPLSQNKEWIERRYSYKNDPFRRQATSLKLTRCVNDVAGAGIDSPGLENDPEAKCSFGLDALPPPVLRKAITHASQSRIDTHFGVVAETRDINANSLLYDFDRWGRLTLIARSWGSAPYENRTFEDRLKLATDKIDRVTFRPDAKVRDWRLLALADYAASSDGNALLRSNLRRFDTSRDSYSGLLSGENTTRETAIFSDGLGRPVQSLREADVCLGVKPDFIDAGINPNASKLADRCTQTSTGIATPSTSMDALGRDLESFESYSIDDKWFGDQKPVREDSKLRLTTLVPPSAPLAGGAPTAPTALTTTTYDAAGRQLLVESRLAQSDSSQPGTIKGTAQYRYRIVRETSGRAPRFEALSLSPRCTASAMWSDARGLKRSSFEDQSKFYQPVATPPIGAPAVPAGYQRNYAKTRGYCTPIDQVAGTWEPAAATAEDSLGGQPARVSYTYDPLQQLTGVDYSLDRLEPGVTPERASIAVRFDQLGRTLELQEPNSGCTRYVFDGLNSLMSESGFRYEGNTGTPCGTSSRVRNEKTYTYSGGRLMQMTYHSLEEQGGVPDQRDTVHFYYDRYPYAALFGEVLEALRFLPNDQANQRFIDVTSRKCDNCIGQPTMVNDRTGARSFSYNELGLPHREVRSIVAPVRDVKQSGGNSETYLPEIAFYQVDNSYTMFGSPVQEQFTESPPMNPAQACVNAGVYTCLASFSVGRKYAPDGAIAELSFNNRPLIRAAQDALGRPAVRWTSNGIATGYRYDPLDMRLNQMTTLLLAKRPDYTMPMQVQADGYQYDGGGNIVSYANRAGAGDAYENDFEFQYDAASRLTRFAALARKTDVSQKMSSEGGYAYDAGHRFKSRSLSITGDDATKPFRRNWGYDYGSDPTRHPLHAPEKIKFTIGEDSRTALLDYDDVGRMTRIGSGATGKETQFGMLSNRAMTWDAEGRLLRVRGVADAKIPSNEKWLREDYVYDSGGNRTLKIDHPITRKEGDQQDKELEAATIYMTPFYARPYDRRGTVQLSVGTLPAVSLSPPQDQNEDPVATYLYSDLPVGSMTAGVTIFGESSDSNASVIARREYSPYGLELTNDRLADTKRGDSTGPMSVFHGKEVDRVTGFSSFGARYYSRDMGIWLKPDPMMAAYLNGTPNGGVYRSANLASYTVAGNDPQNKTDPAGLWFWVDDAAFSLGGGVIGLTGQFVADAFVNHQLSSRRDLAAAFVGGAVFGETALYAVPTMGPYGAYVAGVAGGAASNLTGYAIDRATDPNKKFDKGRLAFDMVAGGLTGRFSGVAEAGVNVGRNSLTAIFKQITTKAQNDTISRITSKTAIKMFLGQAYEGAWIRGALGTGAAGAEFENIRKMLEAPKNPVPRKDEP